MPTHTAVQVVAGDATFNADVVDTIPKRTLGLGGRDGLPQDSLMLFVYPNTDLHGIWMKGMRFAIDIVWLSEDAHVIDIHANTPTEPGKADSELPIYYPKQRRGSFWR